MPSRGSLRNGSPRGSLRTWSQRALLAALVAGVLVFGLRANGLVANEVSTIDESVWLVDPPAGVVVRVNAVAEAVRHHAFEMVNQTLYTAIDFFLIGHPRFARFASEYGTFRKLVDRLLNDLNAF